MKIEQCSLSVERAIESGGHQPAVARKNVLQVARSFSQQERRLSARRGNEMHLQ
jgi:hypothetical protein